MHRIKKIIFLFLFSLFFQPEYAISSPPQQIFKLRIKIENLKNSKGKLIVLIYNKDGTIPDKTFSKYYKKKIISIKNMTGYVEFDNLPEGRYAVNIIHDENSNGKLDKGFLLPKEGFGLSNFDKVNLFHKPNFKQASFLLNTDKIVKIKAIYL